MATRNDRVSQMAIGHLCQNSRAQDGDILDMLNMSVSEYPVLKPRDPFYTKYPLGDLDEDVVKEVLGELILVFSDAETLYYLFEREGVNSTVASGTGWQYVLFVGAVEWPETLQFIHVVTETRVTIGGHAVIGSQVVISDAMGKNWLYFNTATTSFGSTAEFPENVLYLCVSNNRVWGCTESGTIYASKLGDATAWYTFDNLSTDSWSVDMSVALNESVNGCATFNDRPVFFTESRCITVYGEYPSTFSTYTDNVYGVMKGCGESIAEVNGYLYYLSRWGFVRYNSGGTTLISDDIDLPFVRSSYTNNIQNNVTGVRFCTAGSDGVAYYACINTGDKGIIYNFDVRVGLWAISANRFIRNFIETGSGLYAMQTNRKTLLYISGGKKQLELQDEGFTIEPFGVSRVEFAPIFEDNNDYLSRKWLKFLRFRVYLGEDSAMSVELEPALSYDPEDPLPYVSLYDTSFRSLADRYKARLLVPTEETGDTGYTEPEVTNATFTAKRSGWYLIEVPCANMNCDEYVLSLKFVGDFCLRAISREFEILR